MLGATALDTFRNVHCLIKWKLDNDPGSVAGLTTFTSPIGPIGVVRSSHFRSSALNIAPRAATRSMILMPSSIDLVTRSHSARTTEDETARLPYRRERACM
jgi:hypothetical protein